MKSDLERWNQKYSSKNRNPNFSPAPILEDYRHLLDGKGNGLDVACGVGHNSIFLAKLGYKVVGVDGSYVGLNYCREVLEQHDVNIQLILADLDNFVFPQKYFDVVVVIRFLKYSLIPCIKQTLKPGGLLIYQTFNTNVLTEKPIFNKDYLLKPGELAKLFIEFQTIATNDSEAIKDKLTYWIGRKPPSIK